MTVWKCADQTLELTRPLIMGIVNVTPDSFSDGGQHNTQASALAHAELLLEQGADILDIGGESTRPGSKAVGLQEELDRVIPLVWALNGCGKLISVDTNKPEVMIEAAKAGAHIINDVCALTRPGALEAVAQTQLGVCLMHMQGTPRTMQQAPHYEDVVQEVKQYLLDRAKVCEQAGITADRICLDYGFGFGKTVEDNFKLLANTQRFVQTGYPILVGLSRKSSLGVVTGRDVNDRMVASVTGAMLAWQSGAQIVRVHDVAATHDALQVWLATQHQR